MKNCITVLAVVALVVAPVAQAGPQTTTVRAESTWSTLVTTLLHWLEAHSVQLGASTRDTTAPRTTAKTEQVESPTRKQPNAATKMPASLEPGG